MNGRVLNEYQQSTCDRILLTNHQDSNIYSRPYEFHADDAALHHMGRAAVCIPSRFEHPCVTNFMHNASNAFWSIIGGRDAMCKRACEGNLDSRLV